MTTGTDYFNDLDQRSKNISNALDGLNGVITGGSFDRTLIWPAGVIADVGDYIANDIATGFDAFTVEDGVEDAIDTLFEGLPVGDSIKSASEAITDFMRNLVTEANELAESANVPERVTAFKQLNNPQDASATPPNFGYIPAILDVVNAAANSNLNSAPVTDALDAVTLALTKTGAYALFSAYATHSLALLLKSLAVGPKGQDDR